jgi:hypothetical protein
VLTVLAVWLLPRLSPPGVPSGPISDRRMT